MPRSRNNSAGDDPHHAADLRRVSGQHQFHEHRVSSSAAAGVSDIACIETAAALIPASRSSRLIESPREINSLSPPLLTALILPPVRSNRGRCHEASFQRDRMRRLRPCLASTVPGGLGAPPYRHYDRCAGSLLDHRSKDRSGRQARPEVSAAAHRLRTKSPRGATSGARPDGLSGRPRRKAWT